MAEFQEEELQHQKKLLKERRAKEAKERERAEAAKGEKKKGDGAKGRGASLGLKARLIPEKKKQEILKKKHEVAEKAPKPRVLTHYQFKQPIFGDKTPSKPTGQKSMKAIQSPRGKR